MIRKTALGAAVALALLAVTKHVQAVTLTLAALEGAAPITEGNLIFSNFNGTGTVPESAVTVTLSSTGAQFSANWNTAGGQDSTIITYTVQTVTGTLSGTTLTMSGTAVTANGAAHVGETVVDNVTNNTYSLQVFDGGVGNPANQLTDSETFNPAVTSINVVKSIDVSSGPGGAASLNFVENIYTNGGGQPPVIPEPMSLALIPLALGALALRKKISR